MYKNFISYHINKSTGVGGIETLIRNLQINFSGGGIKCIEFYHNVCGVDLVIDNENVFYNRIKEPMTKVPFLGRLIKKYRLFINLKKISDPCVFMIFNPTDLLFIPKSFYKENKIILVQANKFEQYFSFLSKIGMRFFKNKIDVFTVYTEADENRLRLIYPSLSDIIKVIPRGCKIKTALQPAIFSKKIITIARIEEKQKNFNAMIKIMRQLPDYQLDIYGVGDEKEVLDLNVKCGELDNVNFKGVAVDIKSILSEYSLFIMTSRYEGFGQSLIEARSQGLPIVAFNTFDALSHIVVNNETGVIVKNNDYDFFKKSIESILSDEDKFKTLSVNSLLKAQETEMKNINKIWHEVMK